MKNLFGLTNVFYDANSDYDFFNLNESLYIENIVKFMLHEMEAEFYLYDFFVFSNHKKDAKPSSLNYKTSKSKILIYLSDEYNKDATYLSKHFLAIFKAYLELDKLGDNIFPLGIGYVSDVPAVEDVPVYERKYNVFFSGNLNKNRIDFFRNFTPFKVLLPSQRILNSNIYRDFLIFFKTDFSHFFENSIIHFNSTFKSGFTTSEYGDLLGNSKIILSPKGFDRTECFRLYEAMRAGCIIISERLPQIFFYKDSPIIQVDDWKEGIRITKQLLNDPKELERIHLETLKWWNKRCSERAMASYIMRCLALVKN